MVIAIYSEEKDTFSSKTSINILLVVKHLRLPFLGHLCELGEKKNHLISSSLSPIHLSFVLGTIVYSKWAFCYASHI